MYLGLGAHVDYGGCIDNIIISIPDGKLLFVREYSLATARPDVTLTDLWFQRSSYRNFHILLGLVHKNIPAADN